MASETRLHDFPGNAKSAVWKHFGFYDTGDGRTLDKSKAVCKTCLVAIKYLGNTTNLKNHVTKRHPLQTGQAGTGRPIAQQPTITELISSQNKLPFGSQKATSITQAIAEHLFLDLRPISSVESASFKQILAKAEPRYIVPSRSHFKDKIIPNLYTKTKAACIQELKKTDDISITTDCWTSHATQAYMTVTAHFVKPDWEMVNLVLQTRELPGQHTSQHLADAIQQCCVEWFILKPPVTTDNAANVVKAVNILTFQHIPCLAHTLNLAAKAGLGCTSVAKILGRCRRLVGFFKHSTVATNILTEKQNMLGVPIHKLIQDVDTRWNSTHDMLCRLLEQTPALHAAFTESVIRKEARDYLLSPEEQTQAEDLIGVLEPLKTGTKIICQQSSPTISMILPVIRKIETQMQIQRSDSVLISQVKSAVWKNLADRYQQPEKRMFLIIASLLDPRYKNMPYIVTEQLEEAREVLKSLALAKVPTTMEIKKEPGIQENLNNESEQANDTVDALPPLPTIDEVNPPLPDTESDDTQVTTLAAASTEIADGTENEMKPKKMKMESLVDDWFADVVYVRKEPGTKTNEEIVNDEIERYMREDSRPNSTESSLHWWKTHEIVFPNLSKVAKKFMSIPATSVPSERVFSLAGLIVNKQRSTLNPNNVDKLVFLNKNYNYYS